MYSYRKIIAAAAVLTAASLFGSCGRVEIEKKTDLKTTTTTTSFTLLTNPPADIPLDDSELEDFIEIDEEGVTEIDSEAEVTTTKKKKKTETIPTTTTKKLITTSRASTTPLTTPPPPTTTTPSTTPPTTTTTTSSPVTSMTTYDTNAIATMTYRTRYREDQPTEPQATTEEPDFILDNDNNNYNEEPVVDDNNNNSNLSADELMYKDVLDMYVESIKTGRRDYALADGSAVVPDNLMRNYITSTSDGGYTFMDLNNDGINELVISSTQYASEGMIYDSFTIKNGVVSSFLYNGGTNVPGVYRILQDNTFYHVLRNGALTYYALVSINPDFSSTAGDMVIRDNTSYSATGFRYQSGENDYDISEEEFNNYQAAWQNYKPLSLKLFSQYDS